MKLKKHLDAIEKELKKGLGPCDEFEFWCANCMVWRLFNDLRSMTKDWEDEDNSNR